MSKTLEKIQTRPWVAFVDDERDSGSGIMITLADGYDFADDPGCGVKGFNTLADALKGTTARSVIKNCAQDLPANKA